MSSRMQCSLWSLLLCTVVANATPFITLAIERPERLLVLAPHPDDEVLAAGGLIQRVLTHGGHARVVVATAGDGFVEALQRETHTLHPKPADYLRYGEERQAEARRAMDVLGHGLIRLDLLGFPDGGLHRLLATHWSRLNPERSATTGENAVPYPDAEDPHVPYTGSDLHSQLLHILREYRPTLVVFPDVMDWHPDHEGLGMFALLAIDKWLEAQQTSIRRQKTAPIRLLTYLIHWSHDWPPGAHDFQAREWNDMPLYLPDDLPARGHARACLWLTEHQRAMKRDALAQYQTQQRAMRPFLMAFIRATECFSVLEPADARKITGRRGQQHARPASPL